MSACVAAKVDDVAARCGRSTAGAIDRMLTERELDVLRLMPTRLPNAAIAARLYVSINTVKHHTKSIYRKLGVSDRDGAVARAAALGLQVD